MPGLVFYLLVFLTVGVVFLFFHLMLGHFIRPNRPDDEKMTIYECGEPTVGSAWIQFDLRYYVVALLFVVFDVEVAFFFPWAVVFGKANELSKELPEERRAALTQQLVPAELNLAMLDKAAKQQETTTELPADKDEPAPKKADGAGKKKGAGKGDGKGNGKVGGKKGKGDGAQGPALAQGGPPPGGGPQMSPPPGPTQPVAPPQPIDPIDPVAAKGWAWIAFGDIMIFFGVLMVGFAYLWRRGDINWVRSVAAESER
jgi:NADH:ubiquinone oxidoreductase subunit 3 (subunit A)